MQTGTVLYVTGTARLDDPDNLLTEASRNGLDPAWVAVASSAPGWPSPQDATLALAERGAHRIELRAAFLDPGGSVRLAPRGVRIQG